MDINVSLNLKNERKRLNLGQKEISDFLGMSVKQVGRWESSIAIPTDKLAQLSELGFDVNYVITGQRQQPSQIDKALLGECIELLEEVLNEVGRTLEPEIKAKVVAVLYEDSMEDSNTVKPETVIKHLRLVV